MIMKNIFISAALTVAALVSCGPKYTAPESTPGSEIAYSMSFIRNVAANTDETENLVISPYSAGVALSMLAEGAEGKTKEEFSSALNYCLFKAENLGGNDKVVVKSVNSLWVDDSFGIRNSYLSLLDKDFDALATALDFSDPSTVQAINNWCSEHTNGKIKDIIDRLSPATVMVLANALYFNAPWLNPFDEGLTAKAEFHGSTRKSEVDMMFRRGYMNYAEYQGCQLVELPYEGDRYSMLVLLPAAGMDVNDIVGYLNEDLYNAAMKELAPKEVLLRMPKAKLETSLLLNRTLDSMGIKSAFTAAADFKGISQMGPLVLDQVKQKCYVDISESGTEAAAVTVAQVRMTSARPSSFVTMTVNRPYLFFIVDTQNSNVMFAGRVMNL